MSGSDVLRLVDTFQVGAAHCGHTRTVYAGAGMEVWEEIRAPLHFGAYMLGRFPKDTMTVFLAETPAVRPSGCSHCGPAPVIYGDGTIPQVEWHGRDALTQGWAWLRSLGAVADEDDAIEEGRLAA